MNKILPIIMALLGIGVGGALGFFLKPAPAPSAATEEHAEAPGADVGSGHGADAAHAEATVGEKGSDAPPEGREYVTIGKQMIIPVVEGGETKALMLFELALDVPAGTSESFFSVEPRIRDAFLRVLFEMSYTGAFLSTYTDDRVVTELRQNLLAEARHQLGKSVADVLILDMIRQEI